LVLLSQINLASSVNKKTGRIYNCGCSLQKLYAGVVFEGGTFMLPHLYTCGSELLYERQKKEVQGMRLVPVLWHKMSVKDISTE
jgi:hypothetical protein